MFFEYTLKLELRKNAMKNKKINASQKEFIQNLTFTNLKNINIGEKGFLILPEMK
jgi:hypothetical protein